MKRYYAACVKKEMKKVRHQKEKYSKGAVCTKKLLAHHNENYDKSVTEDNQHGPVYNIHKAENCLIMINVLFGNESRLQQGNMFKTIDKSETGRENASDKLKGFTEKITQDNNSKKHNKSAYKKADNEEIRMRGNDLQEKEDMEETHSFNKRSINEVLTSTPHIVTQEEPQTESYLAEDMNISLERALENKQASNLHFCKTLPKNRMVIIHKEKWEDIYSRRKIRKNKNISLPTDWSSYFAEKIFLVNKYCFKSKWQNGALLHLFVN